MTPDEQNILQEFLADLTQVRDLAKDRQADAMISQTIRANPDSVYLLVQHAILADQALHAAQAQIEQMQAQSQTPAAAPMSFLAPAGVPSAPSQAAPYQGGPSWSPQSPAPQPSTPFSMNGGLGSFMRSAGTIAAGVAGGDFLAQGLSNLFAPRGW